MADKSFYNLDDIVELNEKRLEQYTSGYQAVLGRFTNIILVYSAIAVFLIPLIQDIIFDSKINWVELTAFAGFIILLSLSIFFLIRLMLPVEVAYLQAPERYYTDLRHEYEEKDEKYDEKVIDNLLKASYIDELETAITINERVFRRKSSFYYNALVFAFMAALPYLICIGYHVTKKDEKVQIVEIVNTKNIR
jgi:energy-coupling factor transporter transmembrane protein EcfT